MENALKPKTLKLSGRMGAGMSQTQVISLSFFAIILVGTFLLSLPISNAAGGKTAFIDCLFTATSATCVTGLVVVDTAMHWSIFGQCIILIMIQIGGLGFMTIATMLFMLINKKLGLKERQILSESINTLQIGGIMRLTRRIISVTVTVEGVGALLLALRFCPQYGFGRGLYMSIFHSISAFCNAGFDLMGFNGEFSSLTAYSSDVYVNIIIMLLIIIGGIGFLVWDDIMNHGFHFKRYRLHSKIVILITTILIFAGALLIFFAEANATGFGKPIGTRILEAFFSSITARTAGFNTVNTAKLSPAGMLANTILMFIGGSPGSTAGGIKTTTFITLILFGFSYVRKNNSFGMFGRRFQKDVLAKATAVFFTNLTLIVVVTFIICITDDLPLAAVVFETTSAVATVGMSTGITRSFSIVSKLAIIFLMYCGRVGSLSFASALAERKVSPSVMPPSEEIIIG